ncbi:MAG: hypothetical protein HYY67_00640 [Thaumarchaeota archaeon]|nr:hypothetical protein [Nitrososphaerota archaeon]
MGVLPLLLLIFLVALAIVIPLLGIPLLLITIFLVVVFKLIRGTAKVTYKGFNWIVSKSPPSMAGEASGSLCPKCGSMLLKFSNEADLWCPSDKKWFRPKL